MSVVWFVESWVAVENDLFWSNGLSFSEFAFIQRRRLCFC